LARSDLLGVERYLQDQCKPLISAAPSQAEPISVNLPFEAFLARQESSERVRSRAAPHHA
jgi:hypothetical protein